MPAPSRFLIGLIQRDARKFGRSRSQHIQRSQNDMTRPIISIAMRMAATLRKEFGLALDIERLLKDEPYANQIQALAATSANPILRSSATELGHKLEKLWNSEVMPRRDAAS